MRLVQLLITIQNFLSKETDLKMSSFLMSPHAAPSVAMRKMVSFEFLFEFWLKSFSLGHILTRAGLLNRGTWACQVHL